AQVARYFSQAHLYLNGTSWLTSVLPLMMRLSAARTRPPVSAAAEDAAGAAMALSAWLCAAARGAPVPALSEAVLPAGVAGVSSQFSIVVPCIWLLAGFAFFEAFVAGAHGAYGTHDFRFGQRRDCGGCRRGGNGGGFAHGNGIEFAASAGGFLGVGRADGAQVVRGLQPAHPGQLVDVVQLLARNAGHEDVERLRLVYPFGAPRRAFDHPGRIDFEGGGIK